MSQSVDRGANIAASAICSANADVKLDQHLTRWTNIKTILVQYIAFSGTRFYVPRIYFDKQQKSSINMWCWKGQPFDLSCGRSRYPSNTRRSHSAKLMLGQRRRRWPSISLALGERLVFSGYSPDMVQHRRRWANIETTLGERLVFAWRRVWAYK